MLTTCGLASLKESPSLRHAFLKIMEDRGKRVPVRPLTMRPRDYAIVDDDAMLAIGPCLNLNEQTDIQFHRIIKSCFFGMTISVVQCTIAYHVASGYD